MGRNRRSPCSMAVPIEQQTGRQAAGTPSALHMAQSSVQRFVLGLHHVAPKVGARTLERRGARVSFGGVLCCHVASANGVLQSGPSAKSACDSAWGANRVSGGGGPKREIRVRM
jgi:hypothetical protein